VEINIDLIRLDLVSIEFFEIRTDSTYLDNRKRIIFIVVGQDTEVVHCTFPVRRHLVSSVIRTKWNETGGRT